MSVNDRISVSSQRGPRAARGFTLVELMIAITLSLFVIGALGLLFLSSSRAAREIDQSNRLIENGQYALSVLADDLEHAGFFGFFDPLSVEGKVKVKDSDGDDIDIKDLPTAIPNPCATDFDSISLAADFLVHVQGFDNVAEGGLGDDCTPGAKAETDIVVVRRVAGCAACPPGGTCADIVDECPYQDDLPYLQASQCQGPDQLDGGELENHVKLSGSAGALDRTARDCASLAEARRYMVHIYYVVEDYRGDEDDPVPALMRAELGDDEFTSVPIAAGVENLQVEFGIDSVVAPDGAPDAFTPDFSECTHAGRAAPGEGEPPLACEDVDRIRELKNVVAARVQLLTRTRDELTGHVDAKRYILGSEVIEPTEDGYKRRTHQAQVRINNPSMRQEK